MLAVTDSLRFSFLPVLLIASSLFSGLIIILSSSNVALAAVTPPHRQSTHYNDPDLDPSPFINQLQQPPVGNFDEKPQVRIIQQHLSDQHHHHQQQQQQQPLPMSDSSTPPKQKPNNPKESHIPQHRQKQREPSGIFQKKINTGIKNKIDSQNRRSQLQVQPSSQILTASIVENQQSLPLSLSASTPFSSSSSSSLSSSSSSSLPSPPLSKNQQSHRSQSVSSLKMEDKTSSTITDESNIEGKLRDLYPRQHQQHLQQQQQQMPHTVHQNAPSTTFTLQQKITPHSPSADRSSHQAQVIPSNHHSTTHIIPSTRPPNGALTQLPAPQTTIKHRESIPVPLDPESDHQINTNIRLSDSQRESSSKSLDSQFEDRLSFRDDSVKKSSNSKLTKGSWVDEGNHGNVKNQGSDSHDSNFALDETQNVNSIAKEDNGDNSYSSDVDKNKNGFNHRLTGNQNLKGVVNMRMKDDNSIDDWKHSRLDDKNKNGGQRPRGHSSSKNSSNVFGNSSIYDVNISIGDSKLMSQNTATSGKIDQSFDNSSSKFPEQTLNRGRNIVEKSLVSNVDVGDSLARKSSSKTNSNLISFDNKSSNISVDSGFVDNSKVNDVLVYRDHFVVDNKNNEKHDNNFVHDDNDSSDNELLKRRKRSLSKKEDYRINSMNNNNNVIDNPVDDNRKQIINDRKNVYHHNENDNNDDHFFFNPRIGNNKMEENERRNNQPKSDLHTGTGNVGVKHDLTASEEMQADQQKLSGYWERKNRENAKKIAEGHPVTFYTEDIQVGCRELRARRFISDGFCMSEKAIKEVVCAGHCLPIREMPWYAEFVKTISRNKLRNWQCVDDYYRKKRVKLLCKDGDYRTYRIKVVKSCKCKQFRRIHNRTRRNKKKKKKKKRGKKNKKGKKGNKKKQTSTETQQPDTKKRNNPVPTQQTLNKNTS